MEENLSRVLFDSEIETSFKVVIVKLDTMIHVLGQEVMIRYYTDSTKTKINTVLALGVKNGSGRDAYKIISSGAVTPIIDSVTSLPDVSSLVHGEIYLYHDLINDLWYTVQATLSGERVILPLEANKIFICGSDNTIWLSTDTLRAFKLNNILIKADLDDYIERVKELISGKVDKVIGKELSDNNFTDAYKNRLDTITKYTNVQSDWKDQNIKSDSYIKNKPETLSDFRETIKYEIERVEPEGGSLATYKLKKIKNGNATYIGDSISIPRDYLVRSASIKVCEEDNVPVEGLVIGDKYIDFLVNIEKASTEGHIYIPLKDLITPYNSGEGIKIGEDNKISIKVSESWGNGLYTDISGLNLSLATKETSGALSAYDKIRLDTKIPDTIFLTQDEYDLLAEKDEGTLYYIIDDE